MPKRAGNAKVTIQGILLDSKSRNSVTGMHVEATFRNRIAETVSHITNQA